MFTSDHHDSSSSSRMYTSPTFQHPKTGVRSSSARVPISKTAAYSWLQVQKIMESSDHQPKSKSSENKPATTTHEQPAMTRMMVTRNNNNNNLSASSSSSSLNSSVSSDSFSADTTTTNNTNNDNDKRVSWGPGSPSSLSNTVVQGKDIHNRKWGPEM